MATAITHSELLASLHYDPETGVFTWLRKAGGIVAGSRAGFKKKQYLWIGIQQRVYSQHRLAWFYMHGEWPTQLDHINRDPRDNRIANLRPCTSSENQGNTRPHSSAKGTCAYKGVFLNKYGKYQVACGHQHLGVYDEPEPAALAYNKAAIARYGEFALLNTISPKDPS